MKKALAFILVSLILFFAVSCTSVSRTDTETENETSAEQSTDAETESATKADTTKEQEKPMEKITSLHILTIGNSFSVDAMQYLYSMLKQAGITDIVLGNLYIGGCSLEKHVSTAEGNIADYRLYMNTTGSWSSTDGKTLMDGIKASHWDYIVFQETSRTCGLDAGYKTDLPKLTTWVKNALATTNNTDAKFVWHMTWAYPQSSTEAAFANYKNSQVTMNTMTRECVKKYILTNTDFVGVIPSGTSIQNARKSYLGDNLNRDGKHLDKNIGRYIAALTWCVFFTGIKAETVTYNPDASAITNRMLLVAYESVTNAIDFPYNTFASSYTTEK